MHSRKYEGKIKKKKNKKKLLSKKKSKEIVVLFCKNFEEDPLNVFLCFQNQQQQ